MLIFSNIKKYDLNINKYFKVMDIIHDTNNVLIQNVVYDHPYYEGWSSDYEQSNDPNYNPNLPNYILDLPDNMFPTYNIKFIVTYHKNGELHRKDGPAIIMYDIDDKIKEEYWYENGELHREDGPAVIKYREGVDNIEVIWYKNGIIGETYYEMSDSYKQKLKNTRPAWWP